MKRVGADPDDHDYVGLGGGVEVGLLRTCSEEGSELTRGGGRYATEARVGAVHAEVRACVHIADLQCRCTATYNGDM